MSDIDLGIQTWTERFSSIAPLVYAQKAAWQEELAEGLTGKDEDLEPDL